MFLAMHGLGVELPGGWDGRIYRPLADEPGATTRAVMHAANFALPERREDYGGGAVEAAGSGDVLVMLLEFDPEAALTPLFAQQQGMPRRLPPSAFGPNWLQRILLARPAPSSSSPRPAGHGACTSCSAAGPAGVALAEQASRLLAGVRLDQVGSTP